MNLVYPHTTITDELRNLRFNGDPDTADRAQNILSMYLRKKEFYTRRIAELESQLSAHSVTESVSPSTSSQYPHTDGEMPYPHTDIQANLARLRKSLEESVSPERLERLNMLENVRRDYLRKRTWFSNVRASVQAEYPHTDIQGSLDSLESMLEESASPRFEERLSLLRSIRSDYMIKREWFETLTR